MIIFGIFTDILIISIFATFIYKGTTWRVMIALALFESLRFVIGVTYSWIICIEILLIVTSFRVYLGVSWLPVYNLQLPIKRGFLLQRTSWSSLNVLPRISSDWGLLTVILCDDDYVHADISGGNHVEELLNWHIYKHYHGSLLMDNCREILSLPRCIYIQDSTTQKEVSIRLVMHKVPAPNRYALWFATRTGDHQEEMSFS